MKYSEAILKGVQFKRQGFGSMFGESSNIFRQTFGFKPKPTSCVMGAALDGAGILVQLGECAFSGNAFVRVGTNSNPNAIGHVTLPQEWMGLLTLVTDCPDCGVTAQIGYLMPHLNDYHRWTRERIATWIESVENEQRS